MLRPLLFAVLTIAALPCLAGSVNVPDAPDGIPPQADGVQTINPLLLGFDISDPTLNASGQAPNDLPPPIPPNPGVPEGTTLALALLALLALGYTSGAVRPSLATARWTAGRASTR